MERKEHARKVPIYSQQGEKNTRSELPRPRPPGSSVWLGCIGASIRIRTNASCETTQRSVLLQGTIITCSDSMQRYEAEFEPIDVRTCHFAQLASRIWRIISALLHVGGAA